MEEKPTAFFVLCPETIDLAHCESLIRSVTSGGEVIFIGTVREQSHNRKVIRLEFEAFEAMVLKELGKIAAEIKARWAPEAVLPFVRRFSC